MKYAITCNTMQERGIFLFCPVLWLTEASLSNAFIIGTVFVNPTSLA